MVVGRDTEVIVKILSGYDDVAWRYGQKYPSSSINGSLRYTVW